MIMRYKHGDYLNNFRHDIVDFYTKLKAEFIKLTVCVRATDRFE